MEIIYARRMGFCHGVKKAFEGAMELVSEFLEDNGDTGKEDGKGTIQLAEVEEKKGKDVYGSPLPTYILGEIVHNSAVVERIEAYGIRHVQSLEEIKEEKARVVIRAHGGTREQIEELERRGHEILDLTCVVVKKVREKALSLENRHPAVVILGKKHHPEVIGLFSWLKNPYVVTEPSDIEGIPDYDSIGVLSQTTFSRDKIEVLTRELKRRFSQVEVLDTVCPHTDRNQDASVEIATTCDLMLVVGDEHSSNSKRLYEVVKRTNPNTHFISRPEQVSPEWFPPKGTARARRFKVGITAGASTPDWIVEEIARRVESLG